MVSNTIAVSPETVQASFEQLSKMYNLLNVYRLTFSSIYFRSTSEPEQSQERYETSVLRGYNSHLNDDVIM